MSDKPTIIKISKIVQENSLVSTFYFDHELKSAPGQYVMLWIPGIDQKPFSIADDDGASFGLTIFRRGALTEKLFEMGIGGRVGISGPYGLGFSINENTRYILVAGGYGAAPLAFLATKVLARKNNSVDFLIGARSADQLLYEEKLANISNLNLRVATDDGSRGTRGFVTEILENICKEIRASGEKKEILIATCGPEMMEKKVLDIANAYDLPCEISLERFMKCGVGVCGQCAVDPLGICVCQTGPVLKKEIVNRITEFGKYHRDKCGRKIFFNPH
ncbi:MAG: dihydroorotate dehydrogenase electron transfer subunit [Patescibacteria group bacterium]